MTTRARGEATAAKLAASRGGGGGSGEAAADSKAWDGSSRVGDNDEGAGAARGAASSVSRLRAAEEFLLENPELKSVHSNASVRTLLARSETVQQQPAAAVSVA